MLSAVWRKTAQVASDPVLRRWLAERLVGRERGPDGFTPGVPPYLNGGRDAVHGTAAPRAEGLRALEAAPPGRAIALPLPGETVVLAPGEAARLFERRFADTETLLAVHRFAWLPLLSGAVEPGWVGSLWSAWAERHGDPDGSWAWHPYTAAERAINILDYARRAGLPGRRTETVALLAAHAPAIAARLEYHGEHYTSNHLSNDGRGLFLLGLALGLDDFADLGGRILLAEAGRIFAPSGVLREGSTHYHLLLTRNYAGAWLAAEAHARPEAPALGEATRAALAVTAHFDLPGGLPLIGDISPDCPPEFLACLLPGGDLETGWGATLSAEERDRLAGLRGACGPAPSRRLADDGWIRFDHGSWSALWHAAPEGWPAMPGHGHQDLGSFEVHFADDRLFQDPGRGAYGDGGAAGDASARRQNGVTVDGRDPYPPNRPYYSDAFRRRVVGRAPRVSVDGGVELAHDGFARLSGVGTVARRWSFSPRAMTVTDRVDGRGRHLVSRRLHTRHRVARETGGARIETGGRTFRLTADGHVALSESVCWTAYGRGEPATLIELSTRARLPFESSFTVEIV